MLNKLLISLGLVSAGLLLFIFNITTPSAIGAIGLLGVFILGYLFFLSLFTFLLWIGEHVFLWILKILKIRRQVSGQSIKKLYYFSSILSLGPIILIGLHSVGGTNVYEVSLVCIFLVMGCFYVSRRIT